jgi:hypothetical protein
VEFTIVPGGHCKLGHVTADCVLCSFVQTARHQSNGLADTAGWGPPFVHDGYQCVDVRELDVVSIPLDGPGWQHNRRYSSHGSTNGSIYYDECLAESTWTLH